MSYVGQGPGLKTTNIKRFDVTGSTSATHVLSWTAPSEQTLWITINGVKQQDDAYTIAGSPTTVTLSSALVSADKLEIIGVVDMGVSTYPVDGSVSTATLGNSSVTTAKIATDAVTATEIATGAVGTAEIAADAITATELADNAVSNSQVTAAAAIAVSKLETGNRGDTLFWNAATQAVRLAAGTSGQFLQTQGSGADPIWSAVTALPTQTSNAGKYLVTDGTNASWDRESPNLLINGDFDIWVRGTTFNVSNATNIYTADRWRFEGNAFTGSLVRNAFTSGQTDVPDGPGYYARWINDTSALAQQYTQRIETNPPHKLSGQQVTFSCWLRSASGTIADGNLLWVGGSGNVGAITTTWAKYTTTWTIPTQSATYYTVGFNCPANETLLGGVDIAHCQLEFGGVATTFKALTYAQEIAACQRYYYEADTGLSAYSTNAVIGRNHPVQMRAIPTMRWFYAGQNGTEYKVYNIVNAAQNTMTSGNSIFMSIDGLKWWYNLTGGYAGWSGNGANPAGVSCYIKMDAEL